MNDSPVKRRRFDDSEVKVDTESATKPASHSAMPPPNIDQSVSPPSGQEMSIHTQSDKPRARRDKWGTEIKRGSKKHKISFASKKGEVAGKPKLETVY